MLPVELHCAEQGSGRSLVLLHPVGLDNTFWGSLPEAAARSHRVLGLDLCGHGLSPASGRGPSIHNYVEDVHLAITARHAAPAVVLGLSFGGMIAQELALRYPEDVEALVLCGCASGIPEVARPTIRERGLAAERDGMAAVVGPTLGRWFTLPFLSSPAAGRVNDRLLSTSVESFSAAWHAIAGFDCTSRLDAIRVPTLVLAGERDAATSPAATEAMANAILDARFRVLSGAPHMMQIETEDAFSEAVLAFLARHAAAAAA